jgi:tetratricopeptide (TPR) repeat protein
MALQVTKHYTELIKEAALAEREGQLGTAKLLYEQAIKQDPLEEKPFKRLMILYRQQRQYKDELRVIQKALHLFRDFYDHRPEKIIGKNTKAARISKELQRSVSGKAKATPFYPEPIPAWIKRKEAVEKKLGK